MLAWIKVRERSGNVIKLRYRFKRLTWRGKHIIWKNLRYMPGGIKHYNALYWNLLIVRV